MSSKVHEAVSAPKAFAFQSGTSIAVVRVYSPGVVQLLRTFSHAPSFGKLEGARLEDALDRAQPLKGNVNENMAKALSAAIGLALANAARRP